jgi:hypothetical protein
MEGDDDDTDVDEEDEASEEQQIFTAAQILCGNMDESLRLWNDRDGIGSRLSRGQAVLDLLLKPGDRRVGGGGGPTTTTMDRPPPQQTRQD